MNINSTDNSINTCVDNDAKVFDDMLKIVNDSNIENKNEIVNAIKGLKEHKNKPTYKDKLSEFVQLIANCITIFQPFIPALLEFVK